MDGRETMRRDWNYPRFWNHPPEFFCQMHGENHTHDTSHCIVLRKEFAILYPDFMEYRRRRLEAAAPIGGRASGREMYYSHRQQPRLDSGASWSRGRPPPPPQRAGSGPGRWNGRHTGGRHWMGYQPGGRNRGGGNYYEGYSAADLNPYRPRYYSEPYDNLLINLQRSRRSWLGKAWC